MLNRSVEAPSATPTRLLANKIRINHLPSCVASNAQCCFAAPVQVDKAGGRSVHGSCSAAGTAISNASSWQQHQHTPAAIDTCLSLEPSPVRSCASSSASNCAAGLVYTRSSPGMRVLYASADGALSSRMCEGSHSQLVADRSPLGYASGGSSKQHSKQSSIPSVASKGAAAEKKPWR